MRPYPEFKLGRNMRKENCRPEKFTWCKDTLQ